MYKESSMGSAHGVVAPGDCACRVCYHACYGVDATVEAAHGRVVGGGATDVSAVEADRQIGEWPGGGELEHAQEAG